MPLIFFHFSGLLSGSYKFTNILKKRRRDVYEHQEEFIQNDTLIYRGSFYRTGSIECLRNGLLCFLPQGRKVPCSEQNAVRLL